MALLFWVLTQNPRVVSTQCDPFQTPSLRFSLVRVKIKPRVTRITQRHHSQMKLPEDLLLTEGNKSKLITTDHEEEVTSEQCGHRNVTETIIVLVLFMYYSSSTSSSRFYFHFPLVAHLRLLHLFFFIFSCLFHLTIAIVCLRPQSIILKTHVWELNSQL